MDGSTNKKWQLVVDLGMGKNKKERKAVQILLEDLNLMVYEHCREMSEMDVTCNFAFMMETINSSADGHLNPPNLQIDLLCGG